MAVSVLLAEHFRLQHSGERLAIEKLVPKPAVKACLGEDLRQGTLFVFTNRWHSRLKILYRDGTGLWRLIKWLEQGTFSCPKVVDPQTVKLKLVPEALAIVAPLSESLLERGLVAPGLLAQIVVAKYCDHLPLYRLEFIYWTRHQVWLPRQTKAEWV